MDLDSIDPRPFDRYAKFSAQTRRKLLRLVSLYGRGRSFERQAQKLLGESEAALANRLQTATVYAFLEAAGQVAKATPKAAVKPWAWHMPPQEPPWPALTAGNAEDSHPFSFPQVAAARHYIQSRIPFTHEEYEDLDQDSQRVAFTVARLQTESAVKAVQDAIALDLQEGGSLHDFRARIEDELLGSGFSDSGIETVYRTHVGRAYSAGQVAVLQSPAVQSAFPYLKYSATHDSRVRADHLALEVLGLNRTAVYRADDPIWRLFYPPWSWNCRCIVIPLSVADAARHGVREAQEWLASGRPPAVPEYCTIPPFQLPPGWVPVGRRLFPVG